MSLIVDTEVEDGMLTVTRVVSTDRVVRIPETVDGRMVEALGSSFMSGSSGSNGRTLVIPASVRRVSPDALEGASGISSIEYDGELSVFGGFKLVLGSDCLVRCRNKGEDFEFEFMGGTPMCFPEFDDAMLSLCMRLTPEIAVRRLVGPVGLTESNRRRYERFISDSIMPRATQAVASGDERTVTDLIATGMVSDDDLRRLLERSLRSGRIGMTSLLMCEIRRRYGV